MKQVLKQIRRLRNDRIGENEHLRARRERMSRRYDEMMKPVEMLHGNMDDDNDDNIDG